MLGSRRMASSADPLPSSKEIFIDDCVSIFDDKKLAGGNKTASVY